MPTPTQAGKERTHTTKLLGAGQVNGAVFTAEFRKAISDHVTSVIASVMSDPIVLWGESAMRWYGIPVMENHMHILVPDQQLKAAHEALVKVGYSDRSIPLLPVQPGAIIDPNVRWDELGTFYRVASTAFVRPGTTRPFAVLLQGYSAAGATFHIPTTSEASQVGQEDPRTFTKVNGLSIPSLSALARSFLRADFALRARHESQAKSQPGHAVPRTRKTLDVWVSQVKFYGYHPLGMFGMRAGGKEAGAVLPGIDTGMEKFWEKGY